VYERKLFEQVKLVFPWRVRWRFEPRVLVVEDDVHVGTLFGVLLKSQSIAFDLVETAEQGIDEGVILRAGQRTVDVIGAGSAGPRLVITRLKPRDIEVDRVAMHDAAAHEHLNGADALTGALFDGGPAHQPAIAKPADSGAVPLAKVRAFAERAFRPANAVLFVDLMDLRRAPFAAGRARNRRHRSTP